MRGILAFASGLCGGGGGAAGGLQSVAAPLPGGRGRRCGAAAAWQQAAGGGLLQCCARCGALLPQCAGCQCQQHRLAGTEAVGSHAGSQADGGRQRVLFSALFGCRRGHAAKASSSQGVTARPKASAKLGCPWQLKATCVRSSPEVVLVEFPVEHQGHQPGSAEDNALLRPRAPAPVSARTTALTSSAVSMV